VRSRIRSVRSVFPGPVLPGAQCIARAQSRPGRPDDWEVRLSGRGKVLARLMASAAGEAPGMPDRAQALAGAHTDGALEPAPESLVRGLEITGEYRPGPELRALAARFQIQDMDPALLEGIAWASNVVGMTIPGFDGLCAAVAVVVDPQGQGPVRQWIRVRDHDTRTDRIVLEGALVDERGLPRCFGLIECFPFGPTPLPDSAGIASAGSLPPVRGNVVVVGGSRGAGAALALALLERGYVVHVIYSTLAAAAEDLRRLAGPYAKRLLLHRVDAGEASALGALAESLAGPIDGLALCAAPPPLPMGLTAESAGGLAAYVQRSTMLAAVPLAAFTPKLASDDPWILFYSAAAVTDPVRDLPHFTAAKAAVEGLARWTAATMPAARVLVARVPKMRTDLVNTPSARRSAAAPEAVAAAVAQRLTDESLERGLSVIVPDSAGAGALTR
jgi:NAD(P)-dependent dehydrogenase (short-subunit alcohol dehydrogenase family)